MRVAVVGGGLAGLFTASELVHAGFDVVVLEQSPEPGGVAKSIERDGFVLEPAAGSVTLPHPHLSPILERAGVHTEPARDPSLRHVFLDGRLIALQPSPRALLTPLLPTTAKLRALIEPLVRAPGPLDESLAAFCRRRFGRAAGNLLASLMAAGVFAGDPETLSVAAAFPNLAGLEKEHGSVIGGALRRRRSRQGPTRAAAHVPSGGMADLARGVARSLGDRFVGGFEVSAVDTDGAAWVLDGSGRVDADAVVMAVRPTIAAGMMRGELAGLLRESDAHAVAVVWIGGHGASPLPPGFGALTGPDEEMVSVGVLFETSYAPARGPDGSWLAKVIVGGARNPETVAWSDDQLSGIVTEELERMLGTRLSPDLAAVVRHQPGIPHYSTSHDGWLAEIDRRLGSMPGLYLTGWGYRAVGVTGLAADAARVTQRLVARRDGDSGFAA